MPQSTEQVTNHQVHTTVQTLESALTEIDVSTASDVDLIESIERLRQAKELVMSSLDAADPNLVSEQKLNAIDNIFNEQISQINNFKSNGNSAHLTNAVKGVDNLLNQIASLPVVRTTQDVEGLREAIASFRRSIGQHARNLENDYEKVKGQFDELNKRFDEFTNEITSQKTRLDTAISQFQQQFSDAESKRREEYSQEASNTRAELNKVVQSGREEITSVTLSLKELFDVAENERKQQHKAETERTNATLTEILDRGKNDLSELTLQHKETFATLTSEAKESRKTMEVEFSKKVDEYIDQLETRKGEAEKLVQVIGNTGMVGGYQKLANQERRAAWIWHAITFVFLIGLVTFAIIAFHSTIQGDFKLGTFGARAFVAIAFGLGVAWAARQADKHQDVERRGRKMELELASINPYLALLPDDTQFTVKTELAKRFFGQSDPIPEAKGDKQVTGSALDLVRMALEMLAKK